MDVLRLLPPFAWRGTQYPVTARSVGFQHDSATHKLQYRDGELVEQLGSRNLTFSYTLPMRQGIAKGPYVDLFPDGLAQLFADTRDRSEGDLVDPIYGTFVCVPSSFNDDSDPTKRDGTDIKVEFTLSPALDEDQSLLPPTLSGIMDESEALGQELETIDFEQEEPPEATTDIISGINGLLSQPELASNKINASLEDLAFRLDKTEKTLDKLENPQTWGTRRSIRHTRESTVRLARHADNPVATIRKVVTNTTKTVIGIAAELGVTVQQLIQLNPFLARNPVVKPGIAILAPSK